MTHSVEVKYDAAAQVFEVHTNKILQYSGTRRFAELYIAGTGVSRDEIPAMMDHAVKSGSHVVEVELAVSQNFLRGIPDQTALWNLDRQYKEALKELDGAKPAERDRVQAKVDDIRSRMEKEWLSVQDNLKSYAEAV